jgi:transposase-like protein
MGHMEVITRVERRRRYSDEERAAVLAQCEKPGATIVGLSRRLGISASLIHGWRKTWRQAEQIAGEPMQFIPHAMVAEAAVAEPGVALTPTMPASPPREHKPVLSSQASVPSADNLVRPHPGSRPGGINIDLPTGVRLSAPLAEALRYPVRLKPALLAYTEDGSLLIDNNPPENALRGVALGREDWMFAGADCGGERAAAMYSLHRIAKLNGLNPQASLADVLDRAGEAIS